MTKRVMSGYAGITHGLFLPLAEVGRCALPPPPPPLEIRSPKVTTA